MKPLQPSFSRLCIEHSRTLAAALVAVSCGSSQGGFTHEDAAGDKGTGAASGSSASDVAFEGGGRLEAGAYSSEGGSGKSSSPSVASIEGGADTSSGASGASGGGADAGIADCIGSGSVVYASPGENLQNKISSLKPGDTLVLNDGTYKSSVAVENVQGTASAPICIKAAHEGKAIIDMSASPAGGTYTDQPIYVGKGAAYIIVQGIAAHDSPFSVVFVGFDSHDVIIRRVTAYNATTGNYHVFNVEGGGSPGGPSNVLVEDCAGGGMGRYVFVAYHASNVTFRRDFAYWEDTENFSPAPRSGFGVYGATNTLVENVVAVHAVPFKMDPNYYTALWETTDDTTNWPTNGTRVLGSVFLNNWEGYWVNGSAGKDTQFKDCFFQAPLVSTGLSNRDQGDGMMWGTSSGTGGITNCTFTNSVRGLSVQSGSPSLSASLFYKNTTAISNDPGHDHVDFFGNGSLGTTLGSTDKSVDPGYDEATYGTGAYLFIPASSPLKGAAGNGSDIGANILYRTVNGTLTHVPLWPWPMEDRIRAEKNVSVTWATGGGIWKTLTGVYR